MKTHSKYVALLLVAAALIAGCQTSTPVESQGPQAIAPAANGNPDLSQSGIPDAGIPLFNLNLPGRLTLSAPILTGSVTTGPSSFSIDLDAPTVTSIEVKGPQITLYFSEPMLFGNDPNSVENLDNIFIILDPQGNAVPVTIQWAKYNEIAMKLTIKIQGNLNAGSYRFILKGNVTDATGHPLDGDGDGSGGDDYIYDFAFNDPTPPRVRRIDSVADSGDAQIQENETTNAAITQLFVYFNESMVDSDTLPEGADNPANYKLSGSPGGPVPIDSVSYDALNAVATLSINGGVALPDADYTLTVYATLEDLQGNPLDGNADGTGGDNFVRHFTIDTVAPNVSKVNSSADSGDGILGEGERTKVSINQLFVYFSELVVDGTGANGAEAAANYSLTFDPDGAATAVAIDSISYDPGTGITTLGINGGAALAEGDYRLTVANIEDPDGNAMATFTRNFTIDLTPPTITNLNSISDTGDGTVSEGERTRAAISQFLVTFSEDMQPGSAAGGAEYLSSYSLVMDPDGAATAVTIDSVTYNPTTAALIINSNVALSEGSYRLTISGINDEAGNAMAAAFVRNFVIDQTGPSVDGLNSNADSGDGSLDANEVTNAAITQLLVHFDEEVLDGNGAGGAEAAATYSLVSDPDGAATAVAIDSISYDPGTGIATLGINGGAALADGDYRLAVSGIEDLAGNAMASGFTRDFSVEMAVGNDLYVDGSYAGPHLGTLANPFLTINDALDYAAGASIESPVIHISGGAYNEQVIIEMDNVTLIGEDGAGATTVCHETLAPVLGVAVGTIGFSYSGLTISSACP